MNRGVTSNSVSALRELELFKTKIGQIEAFSGQNRSILRLLDQKTQN